MKELTLEKFAEGKLKSSNKMILELE